MAVRIWLRAGLLLLTLTEAVQAGWILILPRNFFAVPWVNLGMPYNEHLLLDFGAMNLALTILLGTAAAVMEHRLVRTALLAYLAFTTTHFIAHTRYLHQLTATEATVLMSLLAAAIVIPVGLLLLTRRTGTNARRV